MHFRHSIFVAVAAGAMLLLTLNVRGQDADQPNEVSINLTEPDGFAIRTMKATRVDGGPMPDVYAIESFDSATQVFNFQNTDGTRTQLAASQLSNIVFRQEVAEQSPVAQEAPWEVRAHPGKKQIVKIRSQDLKIQEGRLLLRDPSAFMLARQGKTIEMSRLVCNAREGIFSIELQPVEYEKHVVGGASAGNTGPGKELQ